MPQQDVIDVIIHVGRNPQGRSLAWRYFREKWEVLNARWVSSFVGRLIVRFKSLTATAAILSDSTPFSYPPPSSYGEALFMNSKLISGVTEFLNTEKELQEVKTPRQQHDANFIDNHLTVVLLLPKLDFTVAVVATFKSISFPAATERRRWEEKNQ